MNWLGYTILALALLGLVTYGVWRWAAATGSAATLEWIDTRFSRDRSVELIAREAHGPHPSQRVELWMPAGSSEQARNVPLIAFYHGGGWHSGSIDDYRFVARSLGERGFATALIGYRLVPDGRFPTMLEDSADGLAKALEMGAQTGLTTERVVLAGHSAGAYNAVMLALNPQYLRKAGVFEERVAGVIGLAGPYDFYPFTSESARDALGNAADPTATQPITFARGDGPPMLLMTGDEDDRVKPRNTRVLARAVRAEGGRANAIIIPDMGHAGIIMAFSKPFERDAVMDPVATFAERVLGSSASVPVQRPDR